MLVRLLRVVWLALMLGVADADSPTADQAPFPAPARFEEVRGWLLKARSATVTAACGSTVAPWVYRGPRGDSLALNAYARADRDARWAKKLAGALMVRADWDSTHRFCGHRKLCGQMNDVPFFVVNWHATGDDVYALINFESRCARVFKVDQPLGTIWFRDRADTVFALIQDALAADSLVHAMATPPEIAPSADADRSPDWYNWVEKLPIVTQQVPPVYPVRAREEVWEGTVAIQALVGEDGVVHDAFVTRSVAGLDDAALAAVWDWRFEPAAASGVAIPVKFTLTNAK